MEAENTSYKRKRWQDVRLLLAIAASLFVLHEMRANKSVYTNQWKNQYIANMLGLIGYQVFDVVRVFYWQGKVEKNKVWAHSKAARDSARQLKQRLDEYNSPLLQQKKKVSFSTKLTQPNIIFIQIESLDAKGFYQKEDGQATTPFLQRLATEGVYFSQAYNQTATGHTSDAEFSVLTGSLPIKNEITVIHHDVNQIYSLPKFLSALGYTTIYFIGDTSHTYRRNIFMKSLGFRHLFAKENLSSGEILGKGLSDRALFDKAAEILHKERGPFFAYITTLTSHYPFNYLKKSWAWSIQENYKRSMRYVDGSVEKFFLKLERIGLLKNTLIVLFGDHESGLEVVSNKKGLPYKNFVQSFLEKEITAQNYKSKAIPVIFWHRKIIVQKVDVPIGQINIGGITLRAINHQPPASFLFAEAAEVVPFSDGPSLFSGKFNEQKSFSQEDLMTITLLNLYNPKIWEGLH